MPRTVGKTPRPDVNLHVVTTNVRSIPTRLEVVPQGTSTQNTAEIRPTVSHPLTPQPHQLFERCYRTGGKRRIIPGSVRRKHKAVNLDLRGPRMCHV